MFNDKLIIAALLAIATSLALGFYTGYDWAATRYEAHRAKDHDAYQAQLNKQWKLANDLSSKLAFAEKNINVKTVEVIKYVTKHTTGAPCLSAGVVGVLQPGSDQGFRAPTGFNDAEDGRPASSDTDISTWIITANQHYETCAVRLNTLVDFTEQTNPLPSDGL